MDVDEIGLRQRGIQVRLAYRPPYDVDQVLGFFNRRVVQAALEQDPFSQGAIARLSGRYPRCATQRAFEQFNKVTNDPALERVENLLVKRKGA